MAVAAARAWAQEVGGQVRRQPGQRLGAGVVVRDGGGGGQGLGEDGGPLGFGQVRRQPGQRLDARRSRR